MDLSGRVLSHYRLVDRVARGGMADVYKAHQESLDRVVALKVLPSALRQDSTFQARFEREARAIARLHHPNILTVYDFGEQDDLTYIVMEYTPGGTLQDRIRRPLPLQEAVEIACQIGDALDYAHRHGVIHRDVKPSNILLTEEGWPLLSDFGLVKVAQESKGITRPSASMGTPEYMSPEQGQGKPIDHRTDIYALGAVLYEMVTGKPPFTGTSPVSLILKHATEPLPAPSEWRPNLPAELEAVIVKALAKAPDDRYASAGDMVQALQEAWLKAQTENPALRSAARSGHPTPFGQLRTIKPPSLKTDWRRIAIALLVPLFLALIVRLSWTHIPPAVSRNVQVAASTIPSPARLTLATPTFTLLPRPTETPSLAPTLTAVPTHTPTATQTHTPHPTATVPPTATPTPVRPRAVANVSASLFKGPSVQTEELDIVDLGESVQIVGRSDEWEYGKWLYVVTDKGSDGFVAEPRFEYTSTWRTLAVIEIDRSQLDVVSTPVTSATDRLSVTPGPLKIEYVWPSGICDERGDWIATFQVKISGGDGKNYNLYWDETPVNFTVKVEEPNVAVFQRQGDIGLLVGTVSVESGGQRASMQISIPKRCNKE